MKKKKKLDESLLLYIKIFVLKINMFSAGRNILMVKKHFYVSLPKLAKLIPFKFLY